MSKNHHYVVDEFLTTFKEGESISHSTVFDTGDLIADRTKAVNTYFERINGIENRKTFFNKEFASYENFDFETMQNAAYSVRIYFVMPTEVVEIMGEITAIDESPLVILGDDDDECKENQETEKLVFNELGLTYTPIESLF